MIDTVFSTLGAADCEAFSDGWLVQPAAAWTSLAYAVVGIALMATAPSSGDRERILRVVFGLLLVGTGVGSFLYHGPQPSIAGFAHDVTFLMSLWFVIIMDPSLPYGLRRSWAWVSVAAVSAVTALLLLLFPASTNLLTAVAVVAFIISDLLMHRVGGIDGRFYATALGLLAASLLFNALGRSGASTCTPGDVIQFHGLWHVLSAGALGAYFISMTQPRNREAPS